MSVIVFELGLGASLMTAAPPDALLARLAQSTTRFWDQFSAITCIETVEQQKLNAQGKTLIDRKYTFDYLMMLQLAGDELMVEESRILQGKAPKESDRALLSTNGFATLLLVFHPLFRESYEFDDGGDVEANGKRYRKVTFQHIRGHRSPSVLQLHNRDYPIEWQGTAWIDPDSAFVARMQVELKSPMTDVGLARLSSDVQYGAVTFRGEAAAAWLPQSAIVEASTEHQRWRNTHLYGKYRQFDVSTDVKTESPKEQ